MCRDLGGLSRFPAFFWPWKSGSLGYIPAGSGSPPLIPTPSPVFPHFFFFKSRQLCTSAPGMFGTLLLSSLDSPVRHLNFPGKSPMQTEKRGVSTPICNRNIPEPRDSSSSRAFRREPASSSGFWDEKPGFRHPALGFSDLCLARRRSRGCGRGCSREASWDP